MPDADKPLPETVQELPDIMVGVGAMKLTGGDRPTISFTLSIPATRRNVVEYLPFLSEMTRLGNAYATFKMTQTKLPETPPQAELPLDGEVTGDPFPAWEKLMDKAEVPVCVCPIIATPDGSEPDDVWPKVDWTHADDGTTSVKISHFHAHEAQDYTPAPDVCSLPNKTVSTMDFTQTEDFNAALVKARGRKVVEELPFDEPKPEDAEGA